MENEVKFEDEIDVDNNVEEEGENIKIHIIRMIIAVLLVVIAHIIKLDIKYELIISILAYIICGYEIVINAFKSIFRGEGLDENVLMTIASIGAFIIGETHEAIAVIIFFQIGEMFEEFSMDKSRNSIKSLVEIMPESANLYIDGNVKIVKPEELKIGDTIIINPYEKIPIDGEIVEGATTLNTAMLTGESIPRYVTVGDSVASGLMNNDKVIKVQVKKEFKDSTASKILDLIENATEKKSKSETFIRSFAKIYTPIVCIISALTFIMPSLFQYLFMHMKPEFSIWAYRALTILVISCPCAILISVPLAFFTGIGTASKMGILIKGTNYVEVLSKVKTFAFDKTGTMTKGVFEVVGIHHCKMSEDEFIKIVAHIEFFSNHPIAKSILKYYGKDIDINKVNDVIEIGGRGLSGVVNGKKVLAGNDKLMKDNNIDFIECKSAGTIVHVAIDGSYEGHILIDDVIKENAEKSISYLKRLGAKKTIMLTGDRESTAKEVSDKIGIDEYHSSLLPDEKLKIVEELIKDERLSFIGDGVNDAPCITRADVGIAMGGVGSDTAIELSDIVLMNDDILGVPKAYYLVKRIMKTVYENIFISIGIKVLVLILSMIGISNMWLAVFSDVGVMILAVLNSMRLMRINNSVKL